MKKRSRTNMKKEADRRCGELVRARGFCELAGKDHIRCGGYLQWAHIVGRRFLSTRWRLDGALCLCSGHHVWYSHNPEAWRAKLDELWPGRYEALWRDAQVRWGGDYEAVLDDLKASESA